MTDDAPPDPSAEQISLEEALGRLDQITRSLEAGDTELHHSLTLYEEGIRLVRLAEEVIRSAELRIERLQAEVRETSSGSE
jgi:exodeoxyribonuclease VII small subunit